MTARIVRGMPAAEYHAAPGISASELRAAHRSGWHWRQYHDGARTESAAMRLGTLIHLAVLEPEMFARVRPLGEVNRRTNEGKALAAAHAAECAAAGLPMCDADEYADVVAIAASVARYEAVPGVTLAQWLPTADRELSIFWQGADGIDRKARLDAYSGGVAFDLKSSKDASARGFARAVSEYGYHIQAAHYTAACEAAGLNVSGFVFAAVEPNAPHVCAMWRLSPLVMARGASDAAKALATIIEARAGRVSGYTTGIEVLPIPWLED